MAKIVNSYEGKRLWELSQFHSMLSDDYLTDADNNLQTKFIFEQFFNKSKDFTDLERLELLNISYSIPSLITDKFSDYVGQPDSPVDFDIADFVSAFIWGGYAVFVPRVVDGEFIVDYASPDEYVIDADGTERLLSYIDDYPENGRAQKYILQQIYYTDGRIENKLYKVTGNLGWSVKSREILGSEVPLNSIAATEKLSDSSDTGLKYSPLVVIHNKKIRTRKYGDSEVRKIRSIISSIEIELVNIQDQFLKHLQAKLAMPASAAKVDKNGQVNIRDLEAFFLEAGETIPQYVFNQNPMIASAFDAIDKFLRQICAIVTIPTEFIGLKDQGGAESADAKRIRMVSFIKKIERIRSKFDSALSQLFEIKKAWKAIKKGDQTDFVSMWPAVFPDDPAQLATQLVTAQDGKLISNKKAIMKYQGISEEEAQAEQQLINEEQATISAADIGI